MKPFRLKDCTLITLSTGERATNIADLASTLRSIPIGSVYYHTWGRLIRPMLQEHEYPNDFAEWAADAMRDPVLAEQLAIVEPSWCDDLEDLRCRLVDVVDARLEERGGVSTPASSPFRFIRARLVVFDTGQEAARPEELADLAPRLSMSSVFYHLIDSRLRSPVGRDDFSAWMEDLGPEYAPVVDELERLDIEFVSLPDLRDRLTRVLREAFPG